MKLASQPETRRPDSTLHGVCILRNMAHYAGVHVYDEDDDLVYADGNFLAVHTNHSGKRVIKLPKKCDVYDLFDGGLLAEDTAEFTVDMAQGSTVLYFIGDQEKYAGSLASLLR